MGLSSPRRLPGTYPPPGTTASRLLSATSRRAISDPGNARPGPGVLGGRSPATQRTGAAVTTRSTTSAERMVTAPRAGAEAARERARPAQLREGRGDAGPIRRAGRHGDRGGHAPARQRGRGADPPGRRPLAGDPRGRGPQPGDPRGRRPELGDPQREHPARRHRARRAYGARRAARAGRPGRRRRRAGVRRGRRSRRLLEPAVGPASLGELARAGQARHRQERGPRTGGASAASSGATAPRSTRRRS